MTASGRPRDHAAEAPARGDGDGAAAPARRDGERPEPGAASVPPGLRTAAAYSWRLLVVAAAAALVVYALGQVLIVVVPFIAAMFMATVLAPPVAALKRRGVPGALASALVLLAALAVVAGLGWGLEARIAAQADALSANVERGLARGAELLADSPLPIGAEDIVDAVNRSAEQLTRGSNLGGVLSGAMLVASILGGIVISLFALFFLLKDGERLWNASLKPFGAARREQLDRRGRRVWTALGAYLRGLVIVAAIDAIFIGLALYLIGVPLVLPLMALTFIGGFFPIVGAFVAGGVAALVALVSGGLDDAVLVVGAAILVQQLEGNLLQPLVMHRQVSLHPLVTLFAVSAGAVVAGVLGALLAVPLIAAGVAALSSAGEE